MKKFKSPYKEIRYQMQLYQWEMAEKLGCDEYRYKLYELGYVKMPVSMQIKILSMEKNNKYKEVIEYLSRLESVIKEKNK